MNNNGDWNKTKEVYDVLLANQGIKIYNKNVSSALIDSYNKKLFDDKIKPCIIGDYDGIEDGDGVIFFNYTFPEIRQLYQALMCEKFDFFERQAVIVECVTMTEYDSKIDVKVAFPPPQPINTLAEVISKRNLRQLRVTESVKEEHMTYFFNGLQEAFPGEDRVILPSPDVRTFDLKPEMAAEEVCQKVIESMGGYDFIAVNFANPDMVGHTGVLQQVLKACETVDYCLSQIMKKIEEIGGVLVVASDHGNCEYVLPKHDESDAAHTQNPVPFYIFNKKVNLRRKGTLADIAPTILDLMEIDIPAEMTGESLIMKN